MTAPESVSIKVSSTGASPKNGQERMTMDDEATPVRRNPPVRRPSVQSESPPSTMRHQTNAASPSRSSVGGAPRSGSSLPPRPPHNARHHHSSSASATASPAKQQHSRQHNKNKQQHIDLHHAQSLPDRIGSAALGGTIDLLKFTTGLAWHTTGALVAPPLHLTRTHILPQLLAALRLCVIEVTPLRLQDWFRILATSLTHVVTLLRSTRCGKRVRKSMVSLLVDVVDLLTTETFRQVIVDVMACVVKSAEAWSTPEAKHAMRQSGVTLTRVVEFMATRESRQLTQDVISLVESVAVLMADPTTIVALAQVTADLCYALEAEEAGLYKKKSDDGNVDAPHDNGDAAAENLYHGRSDFEQQRRMERNQTEAMTSASKILSSDPDATMEQVILSSLGETVANICLEEQESGGADKDGKDDEQDDDDHHSLPSVILAASMNALDDDGEQKQDKLHDSWEALHDDMHPEELPPPPPIRDGTRVDVVYLHEKIHKRSRRSPAERLSTSNERHLKKPRAEKGTGLKDDEKNDDLSVEIEELGLKERRKSTKIQLFPEEDDHDATSDAAEVKAKSDNLQNAHHTDRLHDEAPADHFYRVLDETMTNLRKDALKQMVIEESERKRDDTANMSHGRVLHVAAAGEEPDSYTKSSMKRILNNLRDEIADERKKQTSAPTTTSRRWAKLAFIALVLLLGATWMGLGCFGLYTIMFARGKALPLPNPNIAASEGGATGTQEIVIRVVREVVHVGNDGKMIGKGVERTILSDKAIDGLTQCIVNAKDLQ
ncbi:hypothetical protein MPSEU_000193200 [Mayamaea pseudoterrestris]|nr:hypothetical protein MPSEU_000193200 [Mayamaea pseudoterrestris]